MVRISAIFIAACMVLIAGSIGFVVYLRFGFTGAESAWWGLAPSPRSPFTTPSQHASATAWKQATSSPISPADRATSPASSLNWAAA